MGPVGREAVSLATRRDTRAGWLFITPWVIGFLVFMAYPLLYTVYLSLTDYDVINDPSFVGDVEVPDVLEEVLDLLG